MNVDDVVAERVEAARVRIQAVKRRAALSAARRRGLVPRHAAKLRHLAAGEPAGSPAPPNPEKETS
ncbi:hypothetical protein [Streptomyces clavifer]|uniref:hypothetical protein n=1 Tax=Streptomyces clavifer TaxID=68188 RepID=UPI003664AE7A